MIIKDVMTAHPTCCSPNDTIDTVAKLMLEHDCGEIPVCDGNALIGVVTDRDITCRAVATGKPVLTVPVREVMTRNVYSVEQNEKIEAALDLMGEKMVRRLPVVNHIGMIVGIISLADIIAKARMLKVALLMRSLAKRTRKYGVALA